MSSVENLSLKNTSNPTYKAWMRRIRVTLYSEKTKKSIVFGDNGSKDFNIKIKGTKELSLAQDKGVIEISNIEYDTILNIIYLEYYKIKVEVGYKNGPLETYFNGYVSYISQKIHSRHDTTLYIAYASELVAAYSRGRSNFTLNSSINMYTAMNYICKSNGISNPNLSSKLKLYALETVKSSSGGVVSTMQSLLDDSGTSWVSTADSSLGQMVSITDTSNKRYIEVNPNTMIIAGGNPTINSDGLKLKLLPTQNFITGDILHIDNGWVDVSTSEADVSESFNANYLDKNGDYMIRQITYTFENRGDTFELDILAKAVSLFESLTS